MLNIDKSVQRGVRNGVLVGGLGTAGAAMLLNEARLTPEQKRLRDSVHARWVKNNNGQAMLGDISGGWGSSEGKELQNLAKEQYSQTLGVNPDALVAGGIVGGGLLGGGIAAAKRRGMFSYMSS